MESVSFLYIHAKSEDMISDATHDEHHDPIIYFHLLLSYSKAGLCAKRKLDSHIQIM